MNLYVLTNGNPTFSQSDSDRVIKNVFFFDSNANSIAIQVNNETKYVHRVDRLTADGKNVILNSGAQIALPRFQQYIFKMQLMQSGSGLQIDDNDVDVDNDNLVTELNMDVDMAWHRASTTVSLGRL